MATRITITNDACSFMEPLGLGGAALGNLKALRLIFSCDSRVASIVHHDLSSMARDLTGLETLSVTFGDANDHDTILKPFAKDFHWPQIRRLSLRECAIDFDILASIITKATNLEELTMRSLQITNCSAWEVRELFEDMKEVPGLSYLEMRHIRLGRSDDQFYFREINEDRFVPVACDIVEFYSKIMLCTRQEVELGLRQIQEPNGLHLDVAQERTWAFAEPSDDNTPSSSEDGDEETLDGEVLVAPRYMFRDDHEDEMSGFFQGLVLSKIE